MARQPRWIHARTPEEGRWGIAYASDIGGTTQVVS